MSDFAVEVIVVCRRLPVTAPVSRAFVAAGEGVGLKVALPVLLLEAL